MMQNAVGFTDIAITSHNIENIEGEELSELLCAINFSHPAPRDQTNLLSIRAILMPGTRVRPRLKHCMLKLFAALRLTKYLEKNKNSKVLVFAGAPHFCRYDAEDPIGQSVADRLSEKSVDLTAPSVYFMEITRIGDGPSGSQVISGALRSLSPFRVAEDQ